MGRNTMQKLMTVTDDPNFRSVLEKQYGEYKDIYNQAENKINAKKQNAKKINPIERASSYVMLNMQIMSDKSPSKLAEMIIQGSTMGVVDMTKRLREYPDAPKDVRALGEKLLKLEEYNVTELKKYL